MGCMDYGNRSKPWNNPPHFRDMKVLEGMGDSELIRRLAMGRIGGDGAAARWCCELSQKLEALDKRVTAVEHQITNSNE